ncbi:MAG: hypothetical protein LQ346_006963 [Caloplaca aetnensis]|nr:MAG: hypothetical protein LQ346_006963 [Caloplaca aetnensis]
MAPARYQTKPHTAAILIILVLFSTIVHTSPLVDPRQTSLPQKQRETTDLSSSLVEGRDLGIPPLLLNTSTLVVHSFQHIRAASAPVISAIFTHIDAFTQESVIGGKPIANTFDCMYGALKFGVVSLQPQVKVPWEAIRRITQLLQAKIRSGMTGFFRLTWEIMAGIWVGVIFGIAGTEDGTNGRAGDKGGLLT